MENISFPTAFLAGFLSFVSPCVLPLIPGYLFLISGVAIDELKDKKANQVKILMNSLFFVMGFSIIFIGLGCTASFFINIL